MEVRGRAHTTLGLMLLVARYCYLFVHCFLSHLSPSLASPLPPLISNLNALLTLYQPTPSRAGACRRVTACQAWYGRDPFLPDESLAIGQVTRNGLASVQGYRLVPNNDRSSLWGWSICPYNTEMGHRFTGGLLVGPLLCRTRGCNRQPHCRHMAKLK